MQVLVMATPSFSTAAIARRSRSSIAKVWPRRCACAKSVPRGSVMVGTRTRRWPSAVAAKPSSHCTPASPRLSVSAMMWACVTGTKSAAPKNSPTLIWCFSASCGTGPALPARISCSSSLSFISRSSVNLYLGVPDRLAPFGDFALLKLCEGSAANITDCGDAERLEPAAESLAAANARDLRDQGGCQRLGQVRGGEHAPPGRGLEAGIAGFGDGWHIRHDRRAGLAR